jgi:ATP-dependent exoDNAse (exonuclease V) alpha subunit
MITLNEGQEKAAEKIIDFIEDRLDLPYFTLTGAPGTGKTFMLKEALNRTFAYQFERSAAAVAHAAKNVLSNAFDDSISCYTVAQWLGQRMMYSDTGEIIFKKDAKGVPKLINSRIAILDEASMINDSLYMDIMQLVTKFRIKLLVVGDVAQLPPVKQAHDSKFFDKIDATLTEPMRFLGPIADIAAIYRSEIEDINKGYAGDAFALNSKTNRIDKFDASLNSGYYFKNNIFELVEQAGADIKENSDNINFTRILAYKNATIDILNKGIRKYIYGEHLHQFETGEIVISRGGFSYENTPVIHNGQILKIKAVMDVSGPYEIPCLSLQFHNFYTQYNVVVVKDNNYAMKRYNSLKNELLRNAENDFTQWVHYYNFINSFAYFDYAYAISTYKSQGQTLNNVYVIENEIMGVKPLTLKQKFQALYVAMTRASKNLYIYNKNY